MNVERLNKSELVDYCKSIGIETDKKEKAFFQDRCIKICHRLTTALQIVERIVVVVSYMISSMISLLYIMLKLPWPLFLLKYPARQEMRRQFL